jgi:hypothetical protein
LNRRMENKAAMRDIDDKPFNEISLDWKAE